MPPKAKIYEAFSAIADNRVILNHFDATVTSSDYKKKYQVIWNETEFSSNDNATYWQGYPGYPIIAIWIMKQILVVNEELPTYFKDINWHELNEKNKRNYDQVVQEILDILKRNGVDTVSIEKEVDRIYEEISKLNFKIVKKLTNTLS